MAMSLKAVEDSATVELSDPAKHPEIFRKVDFLPRSGRLDLYARDDGFAVQGIHQGNQSVIFATRIPPRGFAVPAHMHQIDQVFLCIEGQITVRIEGKDHSTSAGGVIVVPKGMVHEVRNDGDTATFYLEVLAPAPTFFSGVSPRAGVTVEKDPGKAVLVTHPEEPRDFSTTAPLMRSQHLLEPEMGWEPAIVYHVQSAPGYTGTGLCFDWFDQFIYVAEGELTVRILFNKFRVPAGTLIVLSGGMPFAKCNEARVPERHFAILTPPLNRDLRQMPRQ